MDEHDWLAQHCEAERPRLWAVAYRVLSERAEDELPLAHMCFFDDTPHKERSFLP